MSSAIYAAFLQNAGLFFRVGSQGWHPGLVCDAPSGHGIRHVVGDWYRTHGGWFDTGNAVGAHGNGNVVGSTVSDICFGHGTGDVIVLLAPTGPNQSHGTRCPVGSLVSEIRWASTIRNATVPFALVGQCLSVKGNALGNKSKIISVF